MNQAIVAMIDPTDHYCGVLGRTPEEVVEACGLLLEFMAGPSDLLSENMVSNYQFFMGWDGSMLASIENDRFCFPEDPPLCPLVIATSEGGNRGEPKEIIYIFPHGIVCVVFEGMLTKWTRMD